MNDWYGPDRSPEFIAWLTERDRQVKADAWDEGYKARAVLDITGEDTNPYRSAS